MVSVAIRSMTVNGRTTALQQVVMLMHNSLTLTGYPLVRQRTTPPITEGDSHTSHHQTESLVTHCDFSAGISET